MRQWEQGWASVDKDVCAGCLSDAALAAAVDEAANAEECSYCGRRGDGAPVAAAVDIVLDAVVLGLRTEYGDPDDEGVGYCSAEGGYLMPTTDTWDLLQELEVTENADLHSDLSGAIDRLWCKRNVYQPAPHEALRWGWAGFREHVKHRTRYTFLLPAPDADQRREWGEIPPEDVPEALVRAVTDGGLTRVLPAGTTWVRARVHGLEEKPESASELGSPPPALAKSNRMSAAGISAFYGASTEAGALAEVTGYADQGQSATVATWVTTRDMLVVDLVNLPAVPSLFDPHRRHLRPVRRFLHDFARDVAKPAQPDDREHLDYVPTQVLAEYLQWSSPGPTSRVMGVLWRSSRDPEVTDCVLFVDSKSCVEHPVAAEEPDAWLALAPNSRRRVDTLPPPKP